MTSKHRNLRKAAILVASLDEEHSSALLAQMSPSQAQAVEQAVAELGAVSPREREEVIQEFFRIGPLVPAKQPSGIDLEGHLPKHLSMSPQTEMHFRGEPRPADNGQPFRFLHEASVESLAPFLEREHPQTIAVVVSHMRSDRAAEILAGLPPDLQIDVARRLVDLDETDPEMLWEIERGLESWLCQQVRGVRRRTAGLTALNNILGAASQQAKQHILTNLARHDRQLARKIAAPVVPAMTFAEFEQLDAASLTVVLHHADPELLVLALAGAGLDFAQRVYDLFPAHEAELLRDSLCALGPTRLSDVEEAQQELVELARQLELRGEIARDNRGRLSVAV